MRLAPLVRLYHHGLKTHPTLCDRRSDMHKISGVVYRPPCPTRHLRQLLWVPLHDQCMLRAANHLLRGMDLFLLPSVTLGGQIWLVLDRMWLPRYFNDVLWLSLSIHVLGLACYSVLPT